MLEHPIKLLVTAGAGIQRQMDCSLVLRGLWHVGHHFLLLISEVAVGQPGPESLTPKTPFPVGRCRHHELFVYRNTEGVIGVGG